MSLNQKQQEALDTILAGHNVFITGPGGTGKSYLIQAICETLSQKSVKHAVTALTGCAALLLGHGAKTIHSWGGIGLGKESAKQIVSALKTKKMRALRNWLLTRVLIIDEVSMMTPELFELLSEVGQLLRKSMKPFGGIQIVFVGDFFQLPPVVKQEDDSPRRFLFESDLWHIADLKVCALTEIVRQKDQLFQKVLEEARMGSLSDQSLQVLLSRQNLDWNALKIKPTLLFSRRAEVDMINRYNMGSLKTKEYTFQAKTVFDPTLQKGLTEQSPEVVRAISKLDQNAPYNATLKLKEGAQVMLIYNLDQEAGLVNGSRGVIEGFTDTVPPIPCVLFKNGSHLVQVGATSWESDDIDGVFRSQIPLIPAWAITIHKCQGATLDSALIDIGPSTFEVGQAYVALSRVRSLEGLYIYDINPYSFKTHPKVVDFYKALE